MSEKPKTLDDQAREASRQAGLEDEAGFQAAIEPFPGSTADIFALDPDIRVGSYRVRPCYDSDLRVLKLNKHPVYDIVMSRVLTGEPSTQRFLPSDPEGHFLAWLFTTDRRVALDRIKADGYAKAVEDADEAFMDCQPKVCIELCGAAADQIGKGMQSRLSYRPTKSGKESGEADLPPSETTSMDSAG